MPACLPATASSSRSARPRRLPGTADVVLDLAGHILLPGLINCHHHLDQILTRNLPAAQNTNLFPWLMAHYRIWGGARRRTPAPPYWLAAASWPCRAAPPCSTTPICFRTDAGSMTRSRPRPSWAFASSPRAAACRLVNQRRAPARRLRRDRGRDPARLRARGRALSRPEAPARCCKSCLRPAHPSRSPPISCASRPGWRGTTGSICTRTCARPSMRNATPWRTWDCARWPTWNHSIGSATMSGTRTPYMLTTRRSGYSPARARASVTVRRPTCGWRPASRR